MSDVFRRLAALREKYPDDIAAIDTEQARVRELLLRKEYSLLPTTQTLMALCRRDIATARLKLATERSLTEEQRRELWHIVDARAWFLAMVAKDYDAELEQIDRELESELSR